ncbi:MAG: hypothetical protein ABIH76_02460 [Candidatus Bathyarchaeota archaeon]
MFDRNCVDVDDSDAVVEWLKNSCRWSETGKRILYSFYKMYAREVGLTVENLRFEFTKKIPFVPSEDMLDVVINSARNVKTKNTLRILKLTGVRIGELSTPPESLAHKVFSALEEIARDEISQNSSLKLSEVIDVRIKGDILRESSS